MVESWIAWPCQRQTPSKPAETVCRTVVIWDASEPSDLKAGRSEKSLSRRFDEIAEVIGVRNELPFFGRSWPPSINPDGLRPVFWCPVQVSGTEVTPNLGWSFGVLRELPVRTCS